jgi:hypothetical protein
LAASAIQLLYSLTTSYAAEESSVTFKTNEYHPIIIDGIAIMPMDRTPGINRSDPIPVGPSSFTTPLWTSILIDSKLFHVKIHGVCEWGGDKLHSAETSECLKLKRAHRLKNENVKGR